MSLIKYDEILKDHLYKKELIGSKDEAEIRAASIIACEKLKKLLNCCNSVELDFYLWVNKDDKSFKITFCLYRNILKRLKMKSTLFTRFIGLVLFIINNKN